MSDLFLKATGIAALALLVAHVLTRRIALLRRFMIPASLLGGLLLLALGPEAGLVLPAHFYEMWRAWPGFLITFLFVGIILSEPGPRSADGPVRSKDVLLQTLFVWFIGVTQLALGFLMTLTVLRFWETPSLFAHIVEIGWIGGHGAAGAFVGIAAELGQPVAGTMSIFSATVGLVVGGTVGLVLVNGFRARGARPLQEAPLRSGTADGTPAATAHEAGERPEQQGDALFRAVILFLLLGLLAAGVRDGSALALGGLGLAAAVPLVKGFPLFSIALVVAIIARDPLRRLGLHSDDVARQSGFLTGLVLEFLILSATATLRLGAASAYLVPFLLLMVAAAIWTVVLLLFFAPRCLPRDCWEELGILNYGMSTGITAVGLMLVRSLRGSVSPRVARIYGMSAPFSAPLIGGGAISLLLPRLTVQGYGWEILAGLLLCASLVLAAALVLRSRL